MLDDQAIEIQAGNSREILNVTATLFEALVIIFKRFEARRRRLCGYLIASDTGTKRRTEPKNTGRQSTSCARCAENG